MVRKWLLAALLLALLIPTAVLAEDQVIDREGLFTASEVTEMLTIIERVEAEHQVDLVVLTSSDAPYDPSESMHRVRDYADDFYDQGGYGMGPDNSGMLILIDMRNRVVWLSTGGVMISYINDSREEEILDACYNDLHSGRYGRGVIDALKTTEKFMNRGRAEGTFLYDEATGKRLSGIHNALTVMEMGVAAIAGIGVAVVFMSVVRGAYELRGSTYSYDRSANTSIAFTRDEEHYLRQAVSRVARSQGSSGSGGSRSGGSGVHRSSGGVSHGGGGRRF